MYSYSTKPKLPKTTYQNPQKTLYQHITTPIIQRTQTFYYGNGKQIEVATGASDKITLDKTSGAKTTKSIRPLIQYLNTLFRGSCPIVAGHLINANFGGEDKTSNLFPITQTANNNHADRVEALIYKRVLGRELRTQKRVAPTDSYCNYTVNVIPYHPKTPLSENNFSCYFNCALKFEHDPQYNDIDIDSTPPEPKKALLPVMPQFKGVT